MSRCPDVPVDSEIRQTNKQRSPIVRRVYRQHHVTSSLLIKQNKHRIFHSRQLLRHGKMCADFVLYHQGSCFPGIEFKLGFIGKINLPLNWRQQRSLALNWYILKRTFSSYKHHYLLVRERWSLNVNPKSRKVESVGRWKGNLKS